jgi:cell division protease FtsH
VERPEREARKAILEVHIKGKPVGKAVDLDMIAGDTPGFSGAELANLVNEAALGATRRDGRSIEQQDFRAAYDKIVLGEKRETKLDPEEKRRVAIHEAGHAIAAHFSERTEPLSRVTIIPFGMALGVTQQTPQADRAITTRPELEARLRVLMGGFAAEKRFMGETSTGAASDLQRASELAFKMVAHFGMSDKLGPIYVEHGSEHPFLGRAMGSESNASDAMVNTIEMEAQSLLSRALGEADALLEEYNPQFDALVAALLDKETLEKEGLLSVLSLEKPDEGVPVEAST